MFTFLIVISSIYSSLLYANVAAFRFDLDFKNYDDYLEHSEDAKIDPITPYDIDEFFIEFICLEAFFFIGIIMSFITSYFDIDQNKWVVDYKKISMKYINGRFIVDFITFIPFAFMVKFKYSRLLIIIKCMRLQRLSDFLDIN